jgi:dephospho-CoA kinase
VIVVGLLGPIAGGKSVVLETLARCGAATIRADDISRELLAPGTEHLHAVIEAFGEGFLEADGSLRRAELAALIFRDAGAREKLNRLVHPAMVERMGQEINDLRRGGQFPVAVIEAANLAEMGGLRLVDRVLLVTAPRAERVRRLMQRDGLTRSEAEARLRVHEEMGIEEAEADYVIETSGTADDTRAKAERLWRRLVREPTRRSGFQPDTKR